MDRNRQDAIMERKKAKRQGGAAAATTAQGLDQSKAKINNKGD